MIKPLSDLTGVVYRQVMKPVLFRLPADQVHESFLNLGEVLGNTPLRSIMRTGWAYQHPALTQKIQGIEFSTPLGLAAGFDYNAQLTSVLPDLGFGWHTIGSITHGRYGGNPAPMLGRLPLSNSLWVNKGFKNPGAAAVIKKLEISSLRMPTGISIGATNRSYDSLAEQIGEYESAFQEFATSGLNHAYYELNISCPNLKVGVGFQDPAALRQLLQMVTSLNLTKPVWVKMPIDLDNQTFLTLVELIAQHHLAGIIVGNLTKDYRNPALFQTEAQRWQKGGFSGKPTQQRSNAKIRLAYRHFGQDLIIVGTGGIFTAADAYQKIRCGASLLQLITGLIYQGPQVVGQIHHGLVKLLQRDGFNHLSAAIGVE